MKRQRTINLKAERKEDKPCRFLDRIKMGLVRCAILKQESPDCATCKIEKVVLHFDFGGD